MSVLAVAVATGPAPPAAKPDSEHGKRLTDRLLNKIEKEHTNNYDVQIGDGMDIGIVGENGKTALYGLVLIHCNVFFLFCIICEPAAGGVKV